MKSNFSFWLQGGGGEALLGLVEINQAILDMCLPSSSVGCSNMIG